jgi:transcriptional regulator with XRE-family HTH domain
MQQEAVAGEGLGTRIRALRGAARISAIREVVSQWRSSGKSQASFCRETGIATVTLARWLRQLEAHKPPSEQAPVLVEVGSAAGREPDDAYEVVLRGGTWLRVPAGFRDADLGRLLAVLSSAC